MSATLSAKKAPETLITGDSVFESPAIPQAAITKTIDNRKPSCFFIVLLQVCTRWCNPLTLFDCRGGFVHAIVLPSGQKNMRRSLAVPTVLFDRGFHQALNRLRSGTAGRRR